MPSNDRERSIIVNSNKGLGLVVGLIFGGFIGLFLGNLILFAGGGLVIGLAIGTALDEGGNVTSL